MRRLLVPAMALLLVGCPKGGDKDKKEDPKSASKDGSKDGGHADEKEHAELPKRVRLTKDVIAAAKIETTKVTKETLVATLGLPGEIAADPDKSARVTSPAAGRLVEVKFKEGAVMKKGDVLAIIRVPEIAKVRSAYNATTAKATAARANANRLNALAEKGLASKQEALGAEAEAASLEAEAKALSEQLGALGMGQAGGGADLVLRAPVSGIVVSRDAVVGQAMTAEQPIASIADLSEVWFLARVFEKDLGRVKIDAPAEVQLNAFPKERFSGKVEYVSKQIDPAARTLTARIRLSNRGELLRIGLFGSARVATGEASAKSGLTVPRNALAEVGGKHVVFVRHPDDDFELHEVVLGESSLGKVEIVSGLREGEDVVSQGVFTLKSAVLKSTLAEED